MAPFDLMVSYKCAIVTLSVRQRDIEIFTFKIFDFKNAVTLKIGLGVCQGHWMSPFAKAHMTLDRPVVVTMCHLLL